MKTLAPWLAIALATAGIGGARAADKEDAIYRIYSDTVAPAEQQAYETGIKTYNECLRTHGFKYAWIALDHVTGDVYSYSYVAGPMTWADVDTMHETGKVCDATFRSEVNPHLKSETSSFAQAMPEISYKPSMLDAKSRLIEVTFFKLKRGHDAEAVFMDVAKKIAAAAAKSQWSVDYSFLRILEADRDAPDFVLLTPAGTWKEFGRNEDASVWAMYEKAEGREAAAAARASVGKTFKEIWSHVDAYDADLTYTPGK